MRLCVRSNSAPEACRPAAWRRAQTAPQHLRSTAQHSTAPAVRSRKEGAVQNRNVRSGASMHALPGIGRARSRSCIALANDHPTTPPPNPEGKAKCRQAGHRPSRGATNAIAAAKQPMRLTASEAMGSCVIAAAPTPAWAQAGSRAAGLGRAARSPLAMKPTYMLACAQLPMCAPWKWPGRKLSAGHTSVLHAVQCSQGRSHDASQPHATRQSSVSRERSAAADCVSHADS